MKINKLFCIDLDIVEKLNKIDNQSKLINELLSNYFQNYSEKSSIFDQKKAFLKQNKAKMKLIRKEMRIIKTLEDVNFDQRCINWVYNKEFNFSDDEIERYIFTRKLKIKIDQFNKCAELVKDNGYLFTHY